jgi:hypothetical protein
MKQIVLLIFLVSIFSLPVLAVTSDVSIEGNLWLGKTLLLDQTTAAYTLKWNNPAAARTLIISDPGGDDIFVMTAETQTLTNKTLTTPVINGTITGTTVIPVVNGGTGISTSGTAGNILRSDGTNFVSQAINTTQSSPADPAGVAFATGTVMMGLAGSVTPARSGKVLIIILGDITNSAASDGANIQIRYGTGAAPANAAAATGTATGGLYKYRNAGSAVPRGIFSIQSIVSGLTVGTTYWIDVTLAATIGGTASIADVTIIAIEL